MKAEHNEANEAIKKLNTRVRNCQWSRFGWVAKQMQTLLISKFDRLKRSPRDPACQFINLAPRENNAIRFRVPLFKETISKKNDFTLHAFNFVDKQKEKIFKQKFGKRNCIFALEQKWNGRMTH